jgi:hypothetical protein
MYSTWANSWRRSWLHSDVAAGIKRRRRAPDRSRALNRADVEALLTRDDIALREAAHDAVPGDKWARFLERGSAAGLSTKFAELLRTCRQYNSVHRGSRSLAVQRALPSDVANRTNLMC